MLSLCQVYICTSSKVRKFEKEIREKPHEFESWDAGLGGGLQDYYEDYEAYGTDFGRALCYYENYYLTSITDQRII